MWTAFDYLYRDGGNFKAFGSVALCGDLSQSDQNSIKSHLESGEFFIAEQVGVPTLYDELHRWSDGPTQSDHCWHEFAGFRELDVPPGGAQLFIGSSEFLARFEAVECWNQQLSVHFDN
jgi:hypothetical protein